jgi:C-terminal processing protease CtpA/Prc
MIKFRFLFFLFFLSFISCNFSDLLLKPVFEPINILEDSVLYSNEIIPYIPEQFDTIGRLFYFAKIYGILKYFPIYQTRIDKDLFFFDYYDRIKNASSKEVFNDVLHQMLECNPIENPSKHNDLKSHDSIIWVKDTNYFTVKLSEQLVEILKINSGYSGYISISEIGVLEFITRSKYQFKDFPDERVRIWGLANYWNIINYFYVHKHLIQENWEQILYNYISEFQKATNNEQYIKAIMQLTAKLNDSHSRITMKHAVENKIIGKYTLDCMVKRYGDSFIVNEIWGDLLDSKLIKQGDIIMKLNDKPLCLIYEELKPLISASNKSSASNAISRLLLLSFEKNNNIQLLRNEQKLCINIQFKTIQSSQKSYYKRQNSTNKNIARKEYGDISYIDISKLSVSNFDNSIISLKEKIILDFRNGINPRISLRLFYYLLPSTNFYNFVYPNIQAPGSFKIHSGNFVGKKGGILSDKNVVLLVNENTQSESEFVVMAFQELPHVKTIGSMTAGADGNICQFIFPGNIGTTFTSIGIRYKNNTETQQCGIHIDEEIHVESIEKHINDTILRRAIEIL